MTQATHTRRVAYGEQKGTFDPETATCTQHAVAAPTTKIGVTAVSPLDPGESTECVICPEPWSDLVGLPVLHEGYGNRGYVYGGPGRHPGWTSLSVSIAVQRATILCADYTSVAPADAPLPDKTDPRIRIEKLAKKRTSRDSGVWLVHLGIPGFEPGLAEKTKTAALATAVDTLAVFDWHATKEASR